MKKTNKVISLVLAVLLAFSSVPLMASAGAVPEKATTLDKIIETENLTEVAAWLVKNVNSRKDLILATVLRYVIFANKDKADYKAALGTRDALKLSEEEAAKIIVDILNKTLKEKTADITSEKWWKPATDIAKVIGITINLDNVDGVIKTANSLCEKFDQKYEFPFVDINAGDLNGLNGKAIDGVTVAKNGNAGALKAVLQWLADNIDLVKKVVVNASKNSLNLGDLNGIKVDGKKLPQLAAEKINGMLDKNSMKQKIHKGLGLSAEIDYKAFTADELLGAWFIKTMSDKVASKDDAKAVTELTLNEFFNKYANQAYAKFLVPKLNGATVKNFIKKINVDGKFNESYTFTAKTFEEIFNAGTEKGFVEQLNDVLCKIVETIVTPETYTELALVKGGNENINGNYLKVLKYTLPIMAKLPPIDGKFDFKLFTAEYVADKTTEELVVDVLKIFFPGWFHFDKFEEANLDKAGAIAKLDAADTIEELLFLAVYLGNEIVEMPESGTWATATQGNFKLGGAALKEYTDKVFDGNSFKELDDKALIRLTFDMAVELGARALHYNRDNTRFVLPDAQISDDATWTADEYLDEVVDWGIEMIKGVPAVADTLPAKRQATDSRDGFFKLNYIINGLFDCSFINGCGNENFTFDIEKMYLDVFLPSFCDFDIDKAVGILSQNEKAEVFNLKLVPAAVKIIDRLLVAVLETNYALGDVDNSKDIKSSDARYVLRLSVSLEKTDNLAILLAADADQNGEIKSADARKILRASVNLETL